MTESGDQRLVARGDLAWAIAVGGIAIVLFTALLWFAWYFAATLFLIFAGMLLGVGLNAMRLLLGRSAPRPQPLRLVIVCLTLAVLLSGVLVLGGATIAQQATVLSNTIKSQLTNVKSYLEKKGVDTSYLELGTAGAAETSSDSSGSPAQGTNNQPHNLPSASALASSGGAIV